jgi:predicted ATP-grasp superfamily ATP-dependent carboligase
MKPLHCREWERLPAGHALRNKKLAVSSSQDELVRQYQSVEAFTSELVVQEIIQGPDTAKFVYLSCYGRDGRRLGSCVVREIRTDPIYFGSASVVEPALDEETHEVCDHFLRSVGYAGICELEVKRDSRDGRIKLIEVNPRYSVTADAAPYAGVDMGWLHYLDLIGIEVAPVEQSKNDFRHICLQRDFSAFRGYRKAGLLPLRALLHSYRVPLHFYDFNPRDWRIALATLLDLFKITFGPSIRRIFPKRRHA